MHESKDVYIDDDIDDKEDLCIDDQEGFSVDDRKNFYNDDKGTPQKSI